MARTEIERTVRQSVFDRLIDLEPANGVEPVPTFAQSVRTLKANLRRDLEWLLNSRRTPVEVPAHFEGLQRSVVPYGLADITSLGRDATETRGTLMREVETAIARFEPRLMKVRVGL